MSGGVTVPLSKEMTMSKSQGRKESGTNIPNLPVYTKRDTNTRIEMRKGHEATYEKMRTAENQVSVIRISSESNL